MDLDFDFKRYIGDRKKAVISLRSDGEKYAFPMYSSLQKRIASSLDVLGIHAELPLLARAQFPDMEPLSLGQSSHVFSALEALSHRFYGPELPVYLTEVPWVPFCATFGSDENFFTLVHKGALQLFSKEQWTVVLGREIGHVQNGHVPLLTSLFLLDRQEGFLGMAGLPLNVLLRTWSKAAQITADRAGLMASLSLEATCFVLDTIISPSFPKTKEFRKQAVALFSTSKLYKNIIGEPFSIEQKECNDQIEQWFKQEDRWSVS